MTEPKDFETRVREAVIKHNDLVMNGEFQSEVKDWSLGPYGRSFIAGVRWARAETLAEESPEVVKLEAELAAIEKERDEWKWEYENLCKFTNDLETEHNKWKARAAQEK